MGTRGVSDPSRDGRSWIGVATALATVGAAAATFAASPAAEAAAPSGGSCVAATYGAQVHFLTAVLAGSPDGVAISGLTVSGFDSSACDGLPVTVVISGNAAGSPAAPATLLLATLDSTRDACSGASLGSPVAISGGSITLNGCATVHDPSRAAYASIHDATQLSVSVAGAVIPVQVGGVATTTAPPPVTSSSESSAGVGGVSTSRQSPGDTTAAAPGNGPGHDGQSNGGRGLASTGTDIALLTVIGILLIFFGALLTRRRRAIRDH